MADIKVNTAGIPQHVSDELCRTLLAAIKRSMSKPGVAEELQRRGEEYLRERAKREAARAAENT